MRIAVTTSSFATYGDEPLRLLEQAGADIVLNPHGRKLTPDETKQLLAGCAGVVAGTEELSAGVLESLPDLKAISRVGVGMDNVDQAAAERLGIKVANTPMGPTRAVAELTVGLALALMRRVCEMDRELRAGTWKKRMGWLLTGKVVGVIGMGRIGQATAKLMRAMGAEVVYADPVAQCADYRCLALDDLLATADIVTLHCSRPAGGGMVIGAREIGRMKSGSWLINCGRGGLVDEAALAEALLEGSLSGAAVDCFDSEPYAGPLTTCPTAVLTPHIGSYAREGRTAMETDAVRNLLRLLGTGKETQS